MPHSGHLALCSALLLAVAAAQVLPAVRRERPVPPERLKAWFATGPAPYAPSIYDPPWASAVPSLELSLDYAPGLTPEQNGAKLKAAAQALGPGARLSVGAGVWSVDSYFALTPKGSATAPIWITAQAGAVPVLTRPNAAQNVLNIGGTDLDGARYFCLRGFVLTGGSAGMRIYGCNNVWIDRCEIHHVADVGISANTHDVAHLYVTSSAIHHTGGLGEGMYLGANNGAVVLRDSVIARNHVYSTGGTQGDGIELKQGSFGNRIAENLVHHTNYPCILVYGTGGQAQNVIERNACFFSNDNVMQVQGEAVVRNNLLVGGTYAFYSGELQAATQKLAVIHNTIVNTGPATFMKSWANKPGMVFANNAVYSKLDTSIRFSSLPIGVAVEGNVAYGPVVFALSGFVAGSGLSDFKNASFDGYAIDFRPAPGGALAFAGSPAFAWPKDLLGLPQPSPPHAGCLVP